MGTEALAILPTTYASNDSIHKNAGHNKSDQVMLTTSMLKQIQKSQKSNIKVRITFKKKKKTLLKLQDSAILHTTTLTWNKRLFKIKPSMPNGHYSGRAVSPLNSRTTTKVAANSVSKFGGILFTPIRSTAVDCYASGLLKVRLSFKDQNEPPKPPKPLHKHFS